MPFETEITVDLGTIFIAVLPVLLGAGFTLIGATLWRPTRDNANNTALLLKDFHEFRGESRAFHATLSKTLEHLTEKVNEHDREIARLRRLSGGTD